LAGGGVFYYLKSGSLGWRWHGGGLQGLELRI
jgi:hypothetical protein